MTRRPSWRPATLAAIAVVAGACREHHLPAPGPAVRADAAVPDAPEARLDALVAQFLDDAAAASPVTATWLGIHGWDELLDDTSATGQAREAARLRRVLDRLEAIPIAALDERHRLDGALLEHQARLALFELTEVRALERDPVRYVAIASSGIYELLASDFEPLAERLRSIVARLSRVRPLFDEARKNVRNPSELSTRRAIELALSSRSFLAETLPRVVAAVGDDRLLADFRTAQGDALRAFDDFANFLQRDLLARAHGEVAFGRDRLAERLRLRESLSIESDVLLADLGAAGERELKLAQRRFEEAARQLAPGKTPPEALRLLDDDHPTAEQLLPAVQQSVDDVLAFVRAHDLVPVPSALPRVEPMPPFLWGYAYLASAAPFEAREQHALFIDPVNGSWDRKAKDEHLRAFGRAPMTLFAIHQPLAHLLLAEARRRAPSTAQRLASGPAFIEGFPRYVEQLLLEEGLAGDGKARLLQRREAVLALCRLVGSLRLHGTGARIDDVEKLFAGAAWMDDGAARREAERVALDPTLLDEALGMLALAKLHGDVARVRGAAFVPRRFHEELLAHGTLPLGILRRLLLGADAAGPLL